MGLFGHIGALRLFVSYSHVLLSEGLEAALAQHVYWGFILLVLTIFGPGKLAVDAWLEHRFATGGERQHLSAAKTA